VLNLRNAAGKLVEDAMHVLVKCLTEMWVLKASFLTSGANLRQEVSSIQHLYSTRPHDNGIISIDYDNDYISREAQPRRNVYWPRPSVCLSLATFPHYCTDPDVTWRISTGCPLVHYWAFAIDAWVSLLHSRTRNASKCPYSLYAWLLLFCYCYSCEDGVLESQAWLPLWWLCN